MSSPVTLFHLLVQQLRPSLQRDKLYSLSVNNYVSGSIDGKKLASFMPDWHTNANMFKNTCNINAIFLTAWLSCPLFSPIRHVCSAEVQRYCGVIFRFSKNMLVVKAV